MKGTNISILLVVQTLITSRGHNSRGQLVELIPILVVLMSQSLARSKDPENDLEETQQTHPREKANESTC